MDLDLAFNEGDKDKPAIIFIHGIGMDKNIWIDPLKSRILGGRLTLKVILCKEPSSKDFGFCKDMPKKRIKNYSAGIEPDSLETLYDDLKIKRYTVITWSQKRPSGPIDSVVSELEEVIRIAKKLTNAGIILIGHSRGGIIARRYLMKKDSIIRGLITISSPHKGSSLAKVACYLKPVASLIAPFFRDVEKGTLSSSFKHILDFLKSKALNELLPDSPLMNSLKDEPLSWIYYISVGGTNPTLFSLYKWRWERLKRGSSYQWVLKPCKIFSVPEIFHRVIPDKFFPDEIKNGKGDGLVSAKSSEIPWNNEHHNFPLNHAQLLFDKRVRDLLVEKIDEIS
ncbi:MAG: esterase/lipase family protein [Thermodesulfovibrionales bacterium]